MRDCAHSTPAYASLSRFAANALTDIYAHSRCYPEIPMYSASYCIRDITRGHIAFSVNDDVVKYASVSGAVYDVHIGDLFAVYGLPDRVYRNRFYATYAWVSGGYRITASSRRDSLFEVVRWLLISEVG